MNKMRLTDAPPEALLELLEGRFGVVLRRLDLDGINFGGNPAFGGQEEIDLDVIAMLLFGIVGIEEELSSRCGDCLCYEVLVQHAFVDREIPCKDLPVKLHGCNLVFRESKAYKQSGIGHVAFHGRIILAQRKPHIGVRAAIAQVADHGIAQPDQRIVIAIELSVLVYLVKHDLLLVG